MSSRLYNSSIVKLFFWGLGAGALVCGLALISPTPAAAHAFGQRYDLPLPLWLYLAGAGATVALSFVVAAVFLRWESPDHRARHLLIVSEDAAERLALRGFVALLQLVAVGLFLLILATGLFGNTSSLKNFAPTMVWVVWWVGLAFFAALVGDLWALINPWKVIFAWAERLFQRLTGKALGRQLDYPHWLGAWPAVIFFMIFAWLEVVSEAGDRPSSLATVVLIYSLLTWIGMLLFGRDAWLENGEVFAIFFRLLGRFAPIAWQASREGEPGGLILRFYAVGLLTHRALSFSMTAFVVWTLSTVSFDGIKETSAWSDFLNWIVEEPLLRAPLLALRSISVNLLEIIVSVAQLVLPVVFLLVFSAVQQVDAPGWRWGLKRCGRGCHRTQHAGDRRGLRADPDAHRHRLSLRPLPLLSPAGRSVDLSPGVRPLRLGLEPLRHSGLADRHQYRQR